MSARVRNSLVMLLAVALLATVAYLVYERLSGKSQAAPKAPKISLIPANPPPPPPPPKEEKKPEPPKEQKEVKVEPTPQVKEAPPAPASPELKMEGAAGDGPSAFAAGKVTREEVVIAPPKAAQVAPVLPKAASGLFNQFTNYASGLKGEVQRHLARRKELRQKSYRVELQLWVERDGRVSRYEIIGSSGDTEIDETLRQSMAELSNFSIVPPDQMPQPIRLSLVTGGR